MITYLKQFFDWIGRLAESHDVNPLLFSILYLFSKVCFLSFIAVAVKKLKAKKPILFPLVTAGLGYSIPYFYLVITGRNISIWVYLFIGLMFIYAGYTIWKKITEKPAPLSI
jgi:hypothetical protein